MALISRCTVQWACGMSRSRKRRCPPGAEVDRSQSLHGGTFDPHGNEDAEFLPIPTLRSLSSTIRTMMATCRESAQPARSFAVSRQYKPQ